MQVLLHKMTLQRRKRFQYSIHDKFCCQKNGAMARFCV